ncbi:unnamed protein product [Brassica oleracea]|uniref:Uncharacterized protein n=2 Tax=Brassica oleracea TaxID=3712 RepID=A0A0D3AEG4_BRAOL|nr:unnamed protein product [Brassica oleracea]
MCEASLFGNFLILPFLQSFLPEHKPNIVLLIRLSHCFVFFKWLIMMVIVKKKSQFLLLFKV